MTFTVELEQETDGRWIGEVPQLPGTLVYGASPEEATAQATALALRVLADRLASLPSSKTWTRGSGAAGWRRPWRSATF